MPVVVVKMIKGRTLQQKRELAKAITNSVVSILDVEPEWVSVVIEEVDRENWATAGELYIDKFGPGCGRVGAGSHDQTRS